MKSLRDWRIEKLIGLRELSRSSGVTHKTIIQIEHGRQVPTLPTIRKLSQALDVEPQQVKEFADAIDQMGKAEALSRPGLRLAYAPASVR